MLSSYPIHQNGFLVIILKYKEKEDHKHTLACVFFFTRSWHVVLYQLKLLMSQMFFRWRERDNILIKNDICTTNFWQLLKQPSFSYSHVFLFSLFFFLSDSLYCFCPIKIEKKWLSQKVYKIGCTNITHIYLCMVYCASYLIFFWTACIISNYSLKN